VRRAKGKRPAGTCNPKKENGRMKDTTDLPQCELCGNAAAYLINGSLYFCEDCRDDIGDEWEDVITVEEIDDDDGWED
jgi:hypothetical protein